MRPTRFNARASSSILSRARSTARRVRNAFERASTRTHPTWRRSRRPRAVKCGTCGQIGASHSPSRRWAVMARRGVVARLLACVVAALAIERAGAFKIKIRKGESECIYAVRARCDAMMMT